MQSSDDAAVVANLLGRKVPHGVLLASTDGGSVDLAQRTGFTVVYVYPMISRPDMRAPAGWDHVPGARGCTAQSCAFRDAFADMTRMGCTGVFGLSVQETAYQREAVKRLDLPFPLLSDAEWRLSASLGLPSFTVEGIKLLRRLTMIVCDAHVEHVIYPVVAPERNAAEVLRWFAIAHETP